MMRQMTTRSRLAAMAVTFFASLALGGGAYAQVPSADQQPPLLDEDLVIVSNGSAGNDTVSMILKQRNFGRYDRGLHNYLFIPKGRWEVGLTASYGSLHTDDIEALSVLKDFDFSGKMYSIRPSVGYTFAHNQSVGLKVIYNRAIADLGSLGLNLGSDDLSFSIRDVKYHSQTYAAAFYYRSYVGLSRAKRFGVFNEVDLSFASGNSLFSRIYNGLPRDTRTDITEVSLNFSPGVCIFIMENVSFNLSFGVFGLKVHKESQSTNGEPDGSRVTSGANFRFNIFNINFGLGVHI